MIKAAAFALGMLAAPALAQVSAPPGPAPSPEVYEQSIRIVLKSRLLDPDSAKLELVRAPRWGSFVAVKTPWSKPETGWLACYSINARNAMGGYTGHQTALFVVNAAGYAQSVYFERDLDQPSGNRVTRECSEP